METGDTLYWQQETHFTPNGVFFKARKLGGTGALEGVWGRVDSEAFPDGQGDFSYKSKGWLHPVEN